MTYYSYNINIDKKFEIYRHTQRGDTKVYSQDVITVVGTEYEAQLYVDKMYQRVMTPAKKTKVSLPISEVFKKYAPEVSSR